jgi:hypothetical protein
MNGTKIGYGIWSEMFLSVTVGDFTITLDDYFFFNEADSLNDWFNWNSNNTQHLLEYRVKYTRDRWSLTASTLVYAGENSVNSVYVEGEYYIVPDRFSVIAGGVFSESSLNFYDKAGITHAGFVGYTDIPVSKQFTIPLSLMAVVSPNYKNASKLPGFGQSPFNFVIIAKFK